GYDGDAVESAHAAAREAGRALLAVVQGYRLVVVVSGTVDADDAFTAGLIGASFAPGPVVFGATAPGLVRAHESAAEALRGFQAAPGWPSAPRPVPAAELLPERALLGDATAFDALDEAVVRPLLAAG